MTGATFSAANAVPLAEVDRGGFVESRHIGSAILISPEGDVIRQWGDPAAPVLARSSLKPLQAVAAVTAGAALQGEALALATASHTGTDRHVEVVRAMLAEGGLTEDGLGCPAQWPSDSATRRAMIADHGAPSPLRMNCSGKHAAMLLACRASGWEVAGYLDPEHPIQLHIREVVERLTGERIAATVTDGCGAPVHAVSLGGLCRAVQRIATASERSPFAMFRAAGSISSAVRQHPWAVQGPGMPDTVMVETFGVLSKFGAEGVQVMVAPDGTAMASKVLDGSSRASALIGITALSVAGALPTETVADFAATHPLFSVTGGGREVGRIRATLAAG